MSTALFRQIGPYEIQRQIGRGGMAMVFLARDTRPGTPQIVALKVVSEGPDQDARDTAEAELRGAELQRTLRHTSQYVPQVYDIGRTGDYLYVAMEYVEGEDLSSVIRRGPLAPERAVAIGRQLCEFLAQVDELEASGAGLSPWTLLHNDLKPNNVRLEVHDRVKVLDFGAAKPLSMSRRVTRNDFYSTPYLSPECLDSGERDRRTDAWALGVILYEMVAGRPPFRADDTRRLEDRIRSRRPIDEIPGCSKPVQAVIAKLLAPLPDDRYEDAQAIGEDLDRISAQLETQAEAEGWPERAADEPPTRRVPASVAEDEPPTRRQRRDEGLAVPQFQQTSPAPLGEPVEPSATPGDSKPAASAVSDTRSGITGWSVRSWIGTFVIVAAVALTLNEGWVAAQSRQAAQTAPSQDFRGLTAVWTEYDRLTSRSWLGGLGVRSLERALTNQTQILAERVSENYRTPIPTVREAQWIAAATALVRAIAVAPGDPMLRGTLRYCQGQLHRIDGEARKSRDQAAQAQREFTEAVTAFREAAELRPKWPDPFIGLARTFIYGLDDIDAGADAMSRAERLGHVIGARETVQLADGYRARAETLERTASELTRLPQERDFLVRARDAYRKALELYTNVAGSPNVPAQIRLTQLRLDRVEGKLRVLDLNLPDQLQNMPTPLQPNRPQGQLIRLQPWA